MGRQKGSVNRLRIPPTQQQVDRERMRQAAEKLQAELDRLQRADRLQEYLEKLKACLTPAEGADVRLIEFLRKGERSRGYGWDILFAAEYHLRHPENKSLSLGSVRAWWEAYYLEYVPCD